MKNITKFTGVIALLFTSALFSCNSNQPKKEEAQKPEAVMSATPMNAVSIKFTVTDFSKWLPVFNSHDSVRKANGITNIAYGRGMDDANSVVVINKFDDLQKAKGFMNDPAMKDGMQKAGVTGTPEVTYMNVIRNDASKTDQMNRMMITHHVKDFNAWLKVYDNEGMAKRQEEGFSDRAMARGIEDTNMVYLVFAVNDMAKAKAAITSEDKKKLMTDAGVDSPPQIFFYKLDKLQE